MSFSSTMPSPSSSKSSLNFCNRHYRGRYLSSKPNQFRQTQPSQSSAIEYHVIIIASISEKVTICICDSDLPPSDKLSKPSVKPSDHSIIQLLHLHTHQNQGRVTEIHCVCIVMPTIGLSNASNCSE